MANVITTHHPHYGFPPTPIHHKPPPLGFGFGMSSTPSMSSWPSTPVHHPQSQWPLSAVVNQATHIRSSKRRFEADEDSEEGGRHAKDVAMDRSPTPERPKRGAPKRARTTPVVVTVSKDERHEKDKAANDSHDVDVGLLLASLPQESLLPLLTSLLTRQPSLKSTVLSLMPRPNLATATQAIANASRKLLDAYPYSNAANLGSSFGGGSFGSSRPGSFGNTSGFGIGRTSPSSFGHHPQTTGMRDEYIISRLRPHIAEFISACSSYLPYFSYVGALSTLTTNTSGQGQTARSDASTLQSLHKDKSHPAETFLFLQAVMNQILSQPPLTRSELLPAVLPRLTEEWDAWITRVDEVVNKEGGMFGEEAVRGWERGLDEFAHAKGDGLEVMRRIRHRWVSKVGWLVGRQLMMEEEV